MATFYYCIQCGRKYESIAFGQKCCISKYYNTIVSSDFSTNNMPILGEGNTPLIASHFIQPKKNIKKLYFKNEMANPTGSFKDRESAYLFEHIVKPSSYSKVAIVSSGNAAISACAYASIYRVECHCYIGQDSPKGKTDFIKLFNGKIATIKGNYESVYRFLVDNLAADTLNITSGQLVDRENGNIAITEEIYKSGVKPDLIVIPVGNGSLLYGIYKGLQKLKQERVITTYPQLVGVEIKGSAPLAEAVRQGKPFVDIPNIAPSIADAGIAAESAFCAPKAIVALKDTAGFMVEIKESDLYYAQKELIQEGLLCEPSSASVVAALLYIKGLAAKTVVAILTGSGQKMIHKILKYVNVDP